MFQQFQIVDYSLLIVQLAAMITVLKENLQAVCLMPLAASSLMPVFILQIATCNVFWV